MGFSACVMKSLPHPSLSGRHPTRRCGMTVRAASTGRRPSQAQAPNFYETLQVPFDASEQELKASYRRLQKEFHPDQSGDQFVDLSAEINDAFATLKDVRRRAEHDRALKEANGGRMPGGSLRRKSGVVGPIRDGAMVLKQAFATSAEERAEPTDHQFAHLVADDIPGGARLSFITVADGSIDVLGALKITAEAQQGADGSPSWEVTVQRVTYGEKRGSLPSEQRVLRSLANALRERAKRVKGHKGLSISGLAAVAAQGFFGAVSIFGATDQEVGDLEAYHLKHDILNLLKDTNGF